MHRPAVDADVRPGGVEGLKVDLPQGSRVHRVGEIRPEGLKIQEIGPVAYLLVRREATFTGP